MEQSLTNAKTMIDSAKQELKSVTMSLAAVKRGYTLEKNLKLKQAEEVTQ